MNTNAIIIAGGALGAVLLLERSRFGRTAGVANRAAAAELAKYGGFAVPSNASMVDAHAAWSATLQAGPFGVGASTKSVQMWLAAYKAGAAADAVNYSLMGNRDPNDPVNMADATDVGAVCSLWGKDAAGLAQLNELGRAVCGVSNTPASWVEDDTARLARVLKVTAALALAMDNADFATAGSRRSDSPYWTATADIPGKIAGKLAGVLFDIAAQPIAMVAVVGLVAWRVLR